MRGRIPSKVNEAYMRLLTATGHRDARTYDDHGAWSLTHNPTTRRYGIEKIGDHDTGTSDPLGYRRYTAAEFIEHVNFALDVLHAYQTNRHKETT